jgi:hypothetical protein
MNEQLTEQRVELALVPRKDVIDNLIATRKQNGVMVLAKMDSAGLQRLQRQYYYEAVDKNILTFVNLVIRLLGDFDQPKREVRWKNVPNGSGLRIEGVFYCKTHTTELRVNGDVKVSNIDPRDLVFSAGDWLYVMDDIYSRAESDAAEKKRIEEEEQQWRKSLQAQAEKESLILRLSD